MRKRAEVEPIRQPTLFQMETAEPATSGRPFSLPNIFLGTSSFTATGWEGSFYPIGMRSKDFLRHYSLQFQAVEIDSTFYGAVLLAIKNVEMCSRRAMLPILLDSRESQVGHGPRRCHPPMRVLCSVN